MVRTKTLSHTAWHAQPITHSLACLTRLTHRSRGRSSEGQGRTTRWRAFRMSRDEVHSQTHEGSLVWLQHAGRSIAAPWLQGDNGQHPDQQTTDNCQPNREPTCKCTLVSMCFYAEAKRAQGGQSRKSLHGEMHCPFCILGPCSLCGPCTHATHAIHAHF